MRGILKSIVPAMLLMLFFTFYFSTVSHAATYSYVDKKGVSHLTDNIDNIPPEYRSHAKTINGGTDGYVPSMGEALQSKEGSEGTAWFKYKEMSWLDKKRLVARAGFTDLGGVLDNIKVEIALAVVLYFVGLIYIFRKVDRAGMRAILFVTVNICMFMVLTSFYIRSSMQSGDSILAKLKLGDTNISADAGKGGIGGKLANLQTMNAERQKMFEMILAESDIK